VVGDVGAWSRNPLKRTDGGHLVLPCIAWQCFCIALQALAETSPFANTANAMRMGTLQRHFQPSHNAELPGKRGRRGSGLAFRGMSLGAVQEEESSGCGLPRKGKGRELFCTAVHSKSPSRSGPKSTDAPG
jgi:hypothetical protein